VKLLIIAGPYEADRIRRAAVLAGFEAVAVEAGDGMSGWITATRPDLIILAARTVDPDPNLALAKVRAVPRGRVPVFILGDADERGLLGGLGDGFFVRPVNPNHLLTQARRLLSPASTASSEAATAAEGQGQRQGQGQRDEGASSASLAGALRLKPLVPAAPRAPGHEPEALARLTDEMAADIDADLDAEIRDVVREVVVARRSRATGSQAEPSMLPTSSSTNGGGQQGDNGGEAVLPWLGIDLFPPSDADEIDSEAPSNQVGSDSGEIASKGRDWLADRDWVLACHRLVVEGDYFQILGVSREASAAEIRLASERLLAELSPGSLSPAAVAELSAELAELRAVVAEAGRLMTNDRLRAQYRRHLDPEGAGVSDSGPYAQSGQVQPQSQGQSSAQSQSNRRPSADVEIDAEPASEGETGGGGNDVSADLAAGVAIG